MEKKKIDFIEKIKTIIDTLQPKAAMVVFNEHGEILYVNDSSRHIANYETLIDFVPNELDNNWRGRLSLKRSDGTIVSDLFTIIPFAEREGKIYVAIGSVENEERYRLIAENSPDLIVTTDLHGQLLYVSPSFSDFCSTSLSNMKASSFLDLVYEKDREYVEKEFQQLLERKEAPSPLQFRIKKDRQTLIDVEARVNRLEKNHFLFIIRDISERKKAERMFYELAYHDAVTELPNRRMFLDRLRKELYQSRRIRSKLAVIFLDIDKFKYINDTYGHDVGDLVLIQFAKKLKQILRPSDLIARLGGDEFTILLPDISDKKEVEAIAHHIKESFNTPIKIEDNHIHVTCSIGIALFPDDGNNVDELLKRADMALYTVKEQGRNEFLFFDREMEEKSLERMLLENELLNAVRNEQFFIEYQPKTDLATGKIFGMEALVRWKHPQLGTIPPRKFISIAEETGAIVSIGNWVLRESLKQNKTWQTLGYPPLRVAVNLSPRQIEPELVNTIQQLLDEFEIDATYLELEVTEHVFTDVDEAATILRQIRDLGVHISLDDFGTGYNSFTNLKELPVDTIKIDASLVQDIERNEESKAIVKTMLEFAKILNLNVIAEGVEKHDQIEALSQDGCTQVQGFLFSKPLSKDEFETYLQSLHH